MVFFFTIFSSSFLISYMAFDRETGTQLAWNQIILDHNIGAEEFKRIYKEISILKQISHPSIIRLYDSWIDEERGNLIFITEAMTSGTLSQFRKRLPVVSLAVVQSWAKQLLSGLEYLHTRTPVIMHRDIKSNNIFMDATSDANRVKIGDLGLATLYTGSMRAEQMSVIGTPEYMAPEFYAESYNQLVDIWAFGLVMLEMVSNKVPYHECNGATAQIFLKVSRGVLPGAFAELRPGPTRDFIAACLLPASVRPSASQLLQAPFILQKMEGTTDSVYVAPDEGKSPGAGRMVVPSTPPAVPLQSQPVVAAPPPAPVVAAAAQPPLVSPRESGNLNSNAGAGAGGSVNPGVSNNTSGPITAPAALPSQAPSGGGANSSSSIPLAAVVSPSPVISPSSSPSTNRGPPPGNNTTQNLSKLAQQGSTGDVSGLEEEDLFASLPSPAVSQLSQRESQRSSSPIGGADEFSKPLRSSPDAVLLVPKPRVASLDSAVPSSSRNGGLKNSGDLKVPRGSFDRVVPDKFVPLSLVVNGVEGDKLSLCLTALRMEAEGVHEKKTNFFFDVSGDNVEEDAQGLVDANKPDFDLDLQEVAALLGRRVAENIHLTNSGRRLRMAPSPVMTTVTDREKASSLPFAAHAVPSYVKDERSKSVPDLDIDAKRAESLERFARGNE